MTCPLDKGPFNSECDGHQPVCPGNQSSWVETIVQHVTTIKASHVAELETAINNERTHPTRRGLSSVCPGNCSDTYVFSGARSISDIVRAEHMDNIHLANNTTSFADLSTLSVFIGKLIEKDDVDELRRAINGTEYNCICDLQCSCDFDCGCNGECPTDYYYYYY